MQKRASGLMAGLFVAILAIPGAAGAQERPNEGQILLEEIPHIAERSVLYSLPPGPGSALEALSTFPEGADAVIGMHLGRLHPTPYEFTPGVAPLVSLLRARAGLLTDPQHLEKKVRDTSNGEVAILLLPIDATTAIVIMPTQVVESDPRATPLPERRVDLSDVTYEINGETRTIEQYMKDGATNAIGFMHDGAFVYDAYQNGFTPHTRHQFWSATKSVTTALVGIAVEDGLVDSITDPIETYIPEATGTAWEGTTVEDLLQMESGIYWVDVPVHQPEELILMGMDFHTNGLYGMTRDDYLLELTRVSEPGAHHRYNSADTQMLAWMLERVYDEAYATVLSEKIWQPAGMESDALIMVDRMGHAFASMGLFATVKDAARFGELFRNGGRNLAGEQVIPEDWVEASTDYSEATGGPRGYQWARWSDGYSAVGYGHQRIAVAPAHDMVGVRFGNDPVDTVAPKEWEALYLAVADALADGGQGAPDEPPAPDEDQHDDDAQEKDKKANEKKAKEREDKKANEKKKKEKEKEKKAKDDERREEDGAPRGDDGAPGPGVELTASVTDAAPDADATPILFLVGSALAAFTVLGRGRSTPR